MLGRLNVTFKEFALFLMILVVTFSSIFMKAVELSFFVYSIWGIDLDFKTISLSYFHKPMLPLRYDLDRVPKICMPTSSQISTSLQVPIITSIYRVFYFVPFLFIYKRLGKLFLNSLHLFQPITGKKLASKFTFKKILDDKAIYLATWNVRINKRRQCYLVQSTF